MKIVAICLIYRSVIVSVLLLCYCCVQSEQPLMFVTVSQIFTHKNTQQKQVLHKLPWFHHSSSFISKIMDISPLMSPSNGNRGVGVQGGICNLKPSQIIINNSALVPSHLSVYALNTDLHMVLLSATRPPLASSFQSFSFTS